MWPDQGNERDPDARLRWRELERQLLQRCTVFDLYRSRRRAAAGRDGDFFLLQAPHWVNVVPVLRNGQDREHFLMVRQYRHGVDRLTVEFPAGLVDPGEDPREAACRELLEETGYRAVRLREIGRIAPNPAFMDNWCSTWLAEDPEPTGGQSLDETEVLDVLQVPVEELVERMGRDGYINAMVLTALYWFLADRGRICGGD